MKRVTSFLAFLTIGLSLGCASYQATRQPDLSQDLKAQGNRIESNGVCCMAKPIHLQSELENYLGDDLLKYGILPVQIHLSNRSYTGDLTFSPDDVNLIDHSDGMCPLMTCDQVLTKAKRSFWRSAGWGVAFGVFGAIPSAINVANTNKKIQTDYESRMLKGGNLIPGAVTEGLVFFSVPPDIASLDGWKLSIVLKDPNTSKKILLNYALFGEVIPRRQEDTQGGADSQ